MNEDNLGPFGEQNVPVRPHLPQEASLWFATYTGHSVPLGRVKQSSADEGRARSHETCINYLGEIAWTERGPSGRWTELLNYEGLFGGGDDRRDRIIVKSVSGGRAKHHESFF